MSNCHRMEIQTYTERVIYIARFHRNLRMSLSKDVLWQVTYENTARPIQIANNMIN